jgi:hypothetical protein
VCAFNPVYGQGMTAAALGAEALDRWLRGESWRRRPGRGQVFQHALARANATPWQLATGADYGFRTTEGSPEKWVARLTSRYLGTSEKQVPDFAELWYQALTLESRTKEGSMDAYSPAVERKMKRLFDSLRENDQRRYAAVEATKLGHGGIDYIARVLRCDPKTIRRGLAELEAEDDLDTNRVRKKGVDGES